MNKDLKKKKEFRLEIPTDLFFKIRCQLCIHFKVKYNMFELLEWGGGAHFPIGIILVRYTNTLTSQVSRHSRWTLGRLQAFGIVSYLTRA